MNVNYEILLCCTETSDIVVDKSHCGTKLSVIGFYGHTSNVQGLDTPVFCISGDISGFCHGVVEVVGRLDSLVGYRRFGKNPFHLQRYTTTNIQSVTFQESEDLAC